MAKKDPEWSGGTRKKRTRRRIVVLRLTLAFGLLVLALPVASQWWEAWRASQGIDVAVSTYGEMAGPEVDMLRKEAHAYNDALARNESMRDRLPYEEQLSWHGSEMIAYLSIPKCSVRLPVYHGTGEKVLMAGVGHLQGTSLPVGGKSSHCVLTAHSGMASRRMFDDIDLLEVGDQYVIWVLGERLAYRVIGSEVVLPEDTSSIAVQEGRDLCTLVTCRPFGVNTHRLLVHAERCPYESDDDEVPDVAVYINGRTMPLILAIVVVVGLAVSVARRRNAAARP